MDDRQLLAQYAGNHSPEAFAELVRRYADLVYSSARRQLGNSDLAEDVSQAVFILLSRKAGGVRGPLGGWLIRTTCFACRDARKMAARRCARERRAAEMKMQEHREPATCHWDDYASLLDGALARLPRMDRDAVVLRFMQGMTLKEAGEAMGISEEAARKRSDRALERLRNSLASQMAVPSFAEMASHLTTHAVEAAPVNLATKIVASAVTAQKTLAASIALKTSQAMLISKFKTAAIFLLIFGLATVAGSAALQRLTQSTLAQTAPPLPAGAVSEPSATVPAPTDFVQFVRYDVLLSDAAYGAVIRLKSQKLETGASSLPAWLFDTADLHRAILEAIEAQTADSVSILHAYTPDIWAIAQKSVRLALNELPNAGRIWVEGGGQGALSSTLPDPDHRVLKLDFPAIQLGLKDREGHESDTAASISFNGALIAGSSLVFSADLTGYAGEIHHMLIVYEAVKAPDWQMGFYFLTRDLRWYLRSGPQGVADLAGRVVVWAARATHPQDEVPANYEQILPDGTVTRATAVMRIDTYPLCWWDPRGQPVNAPQVVPFLTQYLTHPTFMQVEVVGPPEAANNSSPLAKPSAATQPSPYRLFTVLSTGHTAHGAFWAPYGPWKQVGQIEVGQSIDVNRITYALRSVSENASGEVMTDLHTDQAGGDAVTLTAVLSDGREIDPANSDGLIGKLDANPNPIFFGFKSGDVQFFHVWQRKRKLVSLPDFPQRPAQPPETNVTPEQVNAALAKLQIGQSSP
jgi:RNA polymerase sigma factor (sigma-70 family)